MPDNLSILSYLESDQFKKDVHDGIHQGLQEGLEQYLASLTTTVQSRL